MYFSVSSIVKFFDPFELKDVFWDPQKIGSSVPLLFEDLAVNSYNPNFDFWCQINTIFFAKSTDHNFIPSQVKPIFAWRRLKCQRVKIWLKTENRIVFLKVADTARVKPKTGGYFGSKT